MACLVGTWKADQPVGLQNVMDKLGIDYEKQKLFLTAKPIFTFTLIGNDSMKVKIDSEIRNSEFSFKFGEEFNEKTVLGSICKAVFWRISDNEIIHIQRLPEGIVEVDHKVDGNTMIATVYVADTMCTQQFHRQ
ncbi:unnamed protein product [Heterobilharzia americana]|nr:unnamed protein product [Heterobilharzia americana]CAH8595019.1 unnamed protein product [Heterobilharzia americana]